MTLLAKTLLLAGLFVSLGLIAAPAATWPAINPAELADHRPPLEPEAHAEFLLAEVVMNESGIDAEWYHHYRIKVFDDQGVDKFSKISLIYERDAQIRKLEARTLAPDGTATELDRNGAFTNDLVKSSTLGLKILSFAPPALVPGAIIEYRYTEVKARKSVSWPLLFQRPTPARLVRYRLRPPNILAANVNLRCLAFNLPPFEFKQDKEDYFNFETTDVPSSQDEPFQPPPFQSQRSAIIYYTFRGPSTPDAYWKFFSASLYRRTEEATRVDRFVKQTLAKVVTPNLAPEEQVKKIFDYCRSHLANRELEATKPAPTKRAGATESASDILKSGSGRNDDIVIAFVALVRAAGLDARLAVANDRSFIFYAQGMMEPFVFPKVVAAVRIGNTWTLCDPSARYLPYGMLDWKYTGTVALVADKQAAIMVPTAVRPAEDSVTHRTARLSLTPEGQLDGEVLLKMTGYPELAVKRLLDFAPLTVRSEYFLTSLRKQFPQAEIENVVVKHAESALDPIEVSYTLHIPNYAERTGSRLFVQPAVFQKGLPGLFEAETRRSNIVFHHAYTEVDDVTLSLPKGFSLESPSAAPDLDLGAGGKYVTQLSYNRAGHALIYHREFAWNVTMAPVDKYRLLQEVFSVVAARDNHALTLKRDATDSP